MTWSIALSPEVSWRLVCSRCRRAAPANRRVLARERFESRAWPTFTSSAIGSSGTFPGICSPIAMLRVGLLCCAQERVNWPRLEHVTRPLPARRLFFPPFLRMKTLRRPKVVHVYTFLCAVGKVGVSRGVNTGVCVRARVSSSCFLFFIKQFQRRGRCFFADRLIKRWRYF